MQEEFRAEARRIVDCCARIKAWHGTTKTEIVDEILDITDGQIFCNGELREFVFEPITARSCRFKTKRWEQEDEGMSEYTLDECRDALNVSAWLITKLHNKNLERDTNLSEALDELGSMLRWLIEELETATGQLRCETILAAERDRHEQAALGWSVVEEELTTRLVRMAQAWNRDADKLEAAEAREAKLREALEAAEAREAKLPTPPGASSSNYTYGDYDERMLPTYVDGQIERIAREALVGQGKQLTHMSPQDDSDATPCCGRRICELPITDRMTCDPLLVTCKREPGPDACPSKII